MEYEVIDHINFPQSEVMDTFVHNIGKLAEFIPDIKEIRVLESRDEGNKAIRISQWVASAELPGFMKKFFSVKELGWIDRATWDLSKNCVDYELELPAFGKYVTVRGHNEVLPDGDRTKIILKGEIIIEIEKHPAIPKLIGRTLRPKIEKFVTELIKPNLVNSNRALEKYLESKGAKSKKKK